MVLTVYTHDGKVLCYDIEGFSNLVAIDLKQKTLLDEPLRFNKLDGRLEYFNGKTWDVYVSDSEISHAEIVSKGV